MKRTQFLRASLVAFVAFFGMAVSAQPLLNIQTGVQVSWLTASNNTYRPQWSPVPGGSWSNFGADLPGNGTTNSLYDPVAPGTRAYQVLEFIPGFTPVSSVLSNGGFESGNGGTATAWAVTQSAGTGYAVRTNTSPNQGSSHFEVKLATTGPGPVMSFGQANVPVTGGQTYPFSFYAKLLTGSAGQNTQWRIIWNAGGDTGFKNFVPGNNTYAFISNSVTVPANATMANITFYFAGAANAAQSATIDIDDVAFGSSSSGTAIPAQTNTLPATTRAMSKITWPSTEGTEYQPQVKPSLSSGTWSNFMPVVVGDGGIKTILRPLVSAGEFVRLQTPMLIVQPPSNLHTVASGSSDAIGLAWTVSPSFGVIGYRLLYGTESGSLTNTVDVGNVASTIISGLVSNQTYYVTILARSGTSQSEIANTITAQTDVDTGIVSLFNAATPLEPETTIITTNAMITYLADRARDRHAREGQFHIYDHYLSWYWEQRIANIEIIDRVAMGGNSVTFNYYTLAALNPEFRTFFRGQNTVAEYQNNTPATLVSTNASLIYPGETEFHYTATISLRPPPLNTALKVGDRVEVEISQFLIGQRNGRANYDGTVFLYVIGQGVVPWMEGQDMGLTGGVINDVNQNLDSFPVPTNGWMGGRTSLPYQYSNEPEHRFKETAGNISPSNGFPFMLGRRLHHTDFGNGEHSEPDNPVFNAQIGKLGAKFINRSCVECHINNGRALPVAPGQSLLKWVVKVGSDANGSEHPTLGHVLQPQSTSGTNEGFASIASYTTTSGQYGDSASYSLQKPNYAFSGTTPAFFSPRIAPQLVGLGLLEAVSESTILALADPNDADSDGISGRIQTVLDPENGQPRLGRFGYKGGKARVIHQIAGALNTDMGVTTPIFPILDGATTPSAPEISNSDLDLMVRYVALLGVASRRDLTNAQALQGEQLFAAANCTKCHVPTLTTSPYHPMAELRNQTIHPYTDLLLHDMGAGLADNMGEGNATGSEWRTPPLWSIGLTAGVSGGEAYLHDGRARSLEEAILWHGGEANAAKEAFRNMSASERAALVKFLKSL